MYKAENPRALRPVRGRCQGEGWQSRARLPLLPEQVCLGGRIGAEIEYLTTRAAQEAVPEAR